MRPALLLPLLLAACLQPPTPGARAPAGGTSVVVSSTPTDALVTFADGTTCRTPCRVAVPGRVSLTVARAGYAPARAELTTASPPRVTLDLAPVGRTQPVEQGELPPL